MWLINLNLIFRPDVEVKELIETSEDDESREEQEIDPMEIATTVTIVEEDGSTSVVEGAQVSSVDGSGRFGHSDNNGEQINITYYLRFEDAVYSYHVFIFMQQGT